MNEFKVKHYAAPTATSPLGTKYTSPHYLYAADLKVLAKERWEPIIVTVDNHDYVVTYRRELLAPTNEISEGKYPMKSE